MILTTHAIVGGAIASFFPSHPAAAVGMAFASHFLVDAIPHWDYPIRSAGILPHGGSPLTFDRALARDIAFIGTDGLAGTILALLLFATRDTFWVTLFAAWAAMMPDPLQFAHKLYPREPLRTLQRFHGWIHTNYPMKRLGISSQIAFVLAVIALADFANGRFVPIG